MTGLSLSFWTIPITLLALKPRGGDVSGPATIFFLIHVARISVKAAPFSMRDMELSSSMPGSGLDALLGAPWWRCSRSLGIAALERCGITAENCSANSPNRVMFTFVEGFMGSGCDGKTSQNETCGSVL